MSLATPLRHALILSVALAALLSGDALHGVLHHAEFGQAGPASHGSQIHGDDCEHGAELEGLPHDAFCLLCSSSRQHALDLPDRGHALDAPAPTTHAPPTHARRGPSDRHPCAPLGARAPPREA